MQRLLMRNLWNRTTYDTCWVCFLPFLVTACCSGRFVLEETQGGQREEDPEPQHLLALELLMPFTERRKPFLEMIIKGSGAASSRAELSFPWQFPCWQVRLCPGGEMFWRRAKDWFSESTSWVEEMTILLGFFMYSCQALILSCPLWLSDVLSTLLREGSGAQKTQVPELEMMFFIEIANWLCAVNEIGVTSIRKTYEKSRTFSHSVLK